MTPLRDFEIPLSNLDSVDFSQPFEENIEWKEKRIT